MSLTIKIAGLINNEIQNKLNPYVPIKAIMLKISVWLKKLYAIKFQGKPVKILPLRNSVKPNKRENKNKLLAGFLISILKKKISC